LLLADRGYTDEVIVERGGMHRRGIEGIGERFVEERFEGKEGARLIAPVCGPVPEGYARRD
jgi:hypothetical protein